MEHIYNNDKNSYVQQANADAQNELGTLYHQGVALNKMLLKQHTGIANQQCKAINTHNVI